MFSVGPIDLLVATALSIRRFGFLRTTLGGVVLLMAAQPFLPPVPCSCFRPLLRRCAPNQRYVSYMRSDLKNLASQEEIYFADTGVYTADAEALGLVTSAGVRIAIFASADGWGARATHAALGEKRACGTSMGRSPVPALPGDRDSVEGEILCW